jgi:hypothetical protein
METLLNPHFRILWAEVQAHPAEQPPFRLRVGIQSTEASGLIVLCDALIHGCLSLEDAMHRFDFFVKQAAMPLADDFALIYPLYNGVPPDYEASLHYIASMVYEISQARKWGYDRKLPIPVWWDEAKLV